MPPSAAARATPAPTSASPQLNPLDEDGTTRGCCVALGPAASPAFFIAKALDVNPSEAIATARASQILILRCVRLIPCASSWFGFLRLLTGKTGDMARLLPLMHGLDTAS